LKTLENIAVQQYCAVKIDNLRDYFPLRVLGCSKAASGAGFGRVIKMQ
jgi:hypothetical protein